MPLVNAINTAVSGLQAQQTAIDTIGNNLANSTTTAFNAGRVEFATLLSQTIQFGTEPQGFLGGINPIQQGLGVTVSTISQDFSQGDLETTGIASNMAINGDGFFILRNASGEPVYSRAGAFSLDAANLLHDPGTGFVSVVSSSGSGWIVTFRG